MNRKWVFRLVAIAVIALGIWVGSTMAEAATLEATGRARGSRRGTYQLADYSATMAAARNDACARLAEQLRNAGVSARQAETLAGKAVVSSRPIAEGGGWMSVTVRLDNVDEVNDAIRSAGEKKPAGKTIEKIASRKSQEKKPVQIAKANTPFRKPELKPEPETKNVPLATETVNDAAKQILQGDPGEIKPAAPVLKTNSPKPNPAKRVSGSSQKNSKKEILKSDPGSHKIRIRNANTKQPKPKPVLPIQPAPASRAEFVVAMAATPTPVATPATAETKISPSLPRGRVIMRETPPAATPLPTPEPTSEPTPQPTPNPAAPSGLIVDARGLELRPAMTPRVLAQDGSVLLDMGKVDMNRLADRGLVGYALSLESARADERAGVNPLVTRAAARGENGLDIVLPAELQNRLDPEVLGKLLADGRIVIILEAK